MYFIRKNVLSIKTPDVQIIPTESIL